MNEAGTAKATTDQGGATMKSMLKVTTPTDREIVMTRVFNAPRHLVMEAFSKPELLKQWLLGPPGWEMVMLQRRQKAGRSLPLRVAQRNDRTSVRHGRSLPRDNA